VGNSNEHSIKLQIWRGASTTYETGQQAVRELLVGLNPLDGVFFINDLMACRGLDTARREFKRRLPEDLCILGFDNIAQAAWSGYDLTTFARPYSEIAAAVVQNLSTAGPARLTLTAHPVSRGTMSTAL